MDETLEWAERTERQPVLLDSTRDIGPIEWHVSLTGGRLVKVTAHYVYLADGCLIFRNGFGWLTVSYAAQAWTEITRAKS